MDSILTTIKKLLGFDSSYTAFDVDIIFAINSAFSTLTQLGVGPETGFKITSSSETWSSYLSTRIDLELVKQYVYLKVKQIFDPSSSSVVAQAIANEIKELEWRINIAVDPEDPVDDDTDDSDDDQVDSEENQGE